MNIFIVTYIKDKITHLTSKIPATSPGVKILLMVVTFIISVSI